MKWVKTFYLLGYKSERFEVVGLKDDDTNDYIIISVKCNCCGDIKDIKLRGNKAKTIRCNTCRAEEVLVPRFEGDKGFMTKNFELMSRHAYRKYVDSLEIKTTMGVDFL